MLGIRLLITSRPSDALAATLLPTNRLNGFRAPYEDALTEPTLQRHASTTRCSRRPETTACLHAAPAVSAATFEAVADRQDS